MICTALNVRPEPSAMTYPKHSENFEILKPDTVIIQRPSYTPHPIVQSQNSKNHSMQCSYSQWEQDIHSQPHEPIPSMERTEAFPNPAACLCSPLVFMEGNSQKLKWGTPPPANPPGKTQSQ